jgi:alpha-L-fucosidase 2
MNKLFIFSMLALFVCTVSHAQQGGSLKLWYTKPATVWNEALPIGNGRLGAMVYGDPAKEKIQLNEGTFWSGAPTNNDNPDALAALPEVRKLIFDGKYAEAEKLANDKIKAKQFQGAVYQVIGNLQLTFTGFTGYSDYYRELDLERAVFTSTFKVGGVTYKREVFASQPDQVIVMRLSASQNGKLSFSASMDGPLQKTLKVVDNNMLELTGLSGTNEGVTGKVKFNARTKIINQGGSIKASTQKIEVANADEVLILISVATNFVDYQNLTANEVEKCNAFLDASESKNYDELLGNHILAYQKYFNRVSFNLGKSAVSSYPTDLRIKNFSRTKDPELVSMYYQFGRYLLISASQPGGQPATLQGLWNDQVSPSWDSKYTININTEMNYWPAEKTNLTEMHEPLVQMLKELAFTGQKTAKTMYGADGWVTHHNTDIWRVCGMIDGSYWGMWPMGGAWLSQHLWEKYLYSGDLKYLETVYPVLKGACEFYQDFLIEEPKNKWLVVSPSISPENNPSIHSASICAGATMDNQLLFDLYTKTIKTAELLKVDDALRIEYKKTLDRLPPMQIGRLGQLQEWMQDWDSSSDQNRHVSHLYGLFPSSQISPYKSPKLFDAARTSLKYRGDVSTGWSMGWKVNFWARLLDGNHAHKLITDQLTLVDPVNPASGGTYPNMFDAHPPFQIDGNFGCTSGITEMLMQSYDGAIHLLPALPDDWKTGDISGLRAYGGFDVSFVWEKGEVEKITIKSNLGGNCRLRVPNTIGFKEGTLLKAATGDNPNPFFDITQIKEPIVSPSAKLNTVSLKATQLYDFPTEIGKTYELVAVKSPKYKYSEVGNDDPKRIKVDFTELLQKQADYNGFKVKVNGNPVQVDSVYFIENDNEMNIVMKDAFTKNDSIKLAYSEGNVVSKFNIGLQDIPDTLVNNLLYGSSPRIIEAKSSEDGKYVFVTFNKTMQIPNSLAGLTMTAEFKGTKDILFSDVSYLGDDQTTLRFTAAQQVFADYNLTLSVSDSNINSTDSGGLESIANFPIENNSIGLPLQITSAKTSTDGMSVVLGFTKPVATSIEQTNFFTLSVDGNNLPVSNLFTAENSIILSTAGKLFFGNVVKVSYAPGNIQGTDHGALEGFTDYMVQNTIPEPKWISVPGKIEAEKYTTQQGTQTENTSDIGGGQNIGYIDTGDWLEYAININQDTTYTITCRIASQYGGGVITIYLDEKSIGKVNSSNTGGWQTWESVKFEATLPAGKHYLKFVATKGGFNFNWVEIVKKKTVTNIENIEDLKVLVYPNPASDKLFISCPSFEYQKIEIFDIVGKNIISMNCKGDEHSIDFNLPDGSYLLVLSNAKQSLKQKFVIKK